MKNHPVFLLRNFVSNRQLQRICFVHLGVSFLKATKPVRLHNFGDLGAKFRFEVGEHQREWTHVEVL